MQSGWPDQLAESIVAATWLDATLTAPVFDNSMEPTVNTPANTQAMNRLFSIRVSNFMTVLRGLE
jgi:hypothetical protein